MAGYDKQGAQKMVLSRLRAGDTVDKATWHAERHPKTYENWMANDSWFRAEVQKIRAKQGHDMASGEGRKEVPGFREFSRDYLGHRHFWHQDQWRDMLDGEEPRGLHPSQHYIKGEQNLLLINTPPHHAKSETFSVDYPTWRIVQDPNVRILLVSASADRAIKNLDAIKNRLDKDLQQYSKLKDDFAPLDGYNSKDAVWTQTKILINPALRTTNLSGHPTVQAIGIRKKFYGARCDLIILDDVVDFDNAHEYAKQIEWIQGIVDSRLEPESGKLVIVGTRLSAQELYSEILKPEWYVEGESPWSYLSQPAVLEMAEDPKDYVTLWPRTNVHPPGLKKWEPDADGLYPMWDGPRLDTKRKHTSAEIWARVYQQQQVSESTTFKQKDIDGCTNNLRYPGPITAGDRGGRPEGMAGLYVVGGYDPATSGFSALVVLGIDLSTGKRYLLDVYNKRGALPDEVAAVMREWTVRYNINEWRVEAMAHQKTIVQNTEFLRWMSNRAVRVMPHYTGTNKWDEQWGVGTMANLFQGWEQGVNAIEFPNRKGHPGMQALVQQLVAWYPTPSQIKAPVQDTVMALWFAEIRARELTDRAQTGSLHMDWGTGWLSERDREEQVVVNLDWWSARDSYESGPAIYDESRTPGKWWLE